MRFPSGKSNCRTAGHALGSPKSATGRPPRHDKSAGRQTCPVSVEDTVRRQLGGKLFFSEFSNFNPADSITVIGTHYRKAEGKELYREYRFITHNRNSPAHRFFESRYLNSVYMSYLNDPSYRDFYDQMLPDSVKSEYIAPEIRNFNGYWVNLKEYKGDYYLDDDWSWHISFHIADSVKTDLYMDGPYPRKIRTATMLPQGGILLRYHRPIRCTPTSTTRCISRPSTSKEASTGFRAKATISRLRRKPYTISRSSSTPTAREIYFKPARTMISHILIKGKAFSGFPFYSSISASYSAFSPNGYWFWCTSSKRIPFS